MTGTPLDPRRIAEARALKRAGLTAREIAEALSQRHHKPVHYTTIQAHTNDIKVNGAKRRSKEQVDGAKAVFAAYLWGGIGNTNWWNEKEERNQQQLRAMRAEQTVTDFGKRAVVQVLGNVKLHERYTAAASSRDALKEELDEVSQDRFEAFEENERQQAILDWVADRYDNTLRREGRVQGQSDAWRANHQRLQSIETGIASFKEALSQLEQQLIPTQHYHAGIGWVDNDDCELLHDNQAPTTQPSEAHPEDVAAPATTTGAAYTLSYSTNTAGEQTCIAHPDGCPPEESA